MHLIRQLLSFLPGVLLVAITACDGAGPLFPELRGPPASVTIGGITYSAFTAPTPGLPSSVKVTVQAENRGSVIRRADLRGGNCRILLRGYSRAERVGGLVFDQTRDAVCEDIALSLEVHPGESRKIAVTPDLLRLTDRHFPVRLFLSAVIEIESTRLEIAAGEVLLTP